MPTKPNVALRLLSAIGAVLLCASCTLQPASAEPPIAQDQQLHDDIVAVMAAVELDWNNANYDGLKSHWDLADDKPIYLAEESDIVMTSWAEIEDYWKGTDEWNEWIVIEYSDHTVKRIDENNAMVTFDLRFDVKLNDRPNPIGGDNRGVVSLRKVEGVWKIHAWVEAPLAAITYMRKLYELNVREDLPSRTAD